MADHRPHRRPILRSVVCGLAIGAVGCSSGTSTQSGPATTALATPIRSTDAPTTAVVITRPLTTAVETLPSTVPSSTLAPVDGSAQLSQAIAAIAPGYHFSTSLSVDGTIVLSADGDHVGDGTRLGLVKDGATVQYVITPRGTWAQPEGGEWQQLNTGASSSDPVAALAAFTSATVSGTDGTATLIDAAVPAAGLGLSGDANVALNVRIDSGTVTSISYQTTIDGHPATMSAAIGPVVDGSPVVPPS